MFTPIGLINYQEFKEVQTMCHAHQFTGLLAVHHHQMKEKVLLHPAEGIVYQERNILEFTDDGMTLICHQTAQKVPPLQHNRGQRLEQVHLQIESISEARLV